MRSCDHLVTRLLVIVVTVCVLGSSSSNVHVEAQNTNFSYASFSTPERFLMVEDVQHYADNLSFLMNARSAALQSSSCGRLLFEDKVRMKDSASGEVASFNTAFTFKISGPNIFVDPDFGVLHADGLAFTFAKNDSLMGQDAGSTLCLLKEQDNGKPSNRIFAVEFDTFPNYWWNDPSDSHIGINVNSMNSTVAYNLCGGKVMNCSYLCNGGYFTAWIDYDSASRNLDVFFANGSLYNNIAKPPKPMLNASVSLQGLLDDYMYVGFSSSTGLYSEVHEIQSWRFTSSGMPELASAPPPGVVITNPASDSSQGSSKVGVIAGVSAGAVAALLLLCFLISRCWRRTSSKKQDKFNLVDQNLVPRMFTYKELSKATNNFSRRELLGSGGFGAVYKGTLPSGAVVAVKRMRHESKHGEESFQAEAASLSQIRQRNLVQLRGWCHEEEQLFLVYDYMCNGSLDDWLFHFSQRREKGNGKAMINLKDAEALPLTLRHSVLSGVAAALAYLHEECAQCVLHRDIKSSNVLLDGDLNAYLGDFGLARLIDHRKMEKTTMMAGTLGYMAPEMPHTGKATKETDVYSFGILTLEVMCGARPLDMAFIERGDGVLVDRVWRAHEMGDILQVTDPSLVTFAHSRTETVSYSEFESQEASLFLITPAAENDRKVITTLLQLGLLCCNPNPEGRPSMRTVSQLMLQSLENMEMSTPPLPSCKPKSHYTRPGFSELDMRGLSTSSSVVSVINVQEAAQESSQSTPPSSGFSSNREPATMQTSFVASSSVFSGR
ncbi:hypothetical protein M758_2G225100 [Ceratodon purpureus]|nr:hypothetical protein M758_2G225100 [Ceratodon purpureus]